MTVKQSDEVASLIERFLDGSIGKWEWDDFVSVRHRDAELELVRGRAADLPFEFPPSKPGYYCGEEGLRVLTRLAADLRLRAAELRQDEWWNRP
jgi:hypothetical protein